MSLKRSAHVKHETSDKIRELRRQVLQMLEHGKASTLDAMRSNVVEVKRDNGRSESGNAEGNRCCREAPKKGQDTPLYGRVKQGQDLLSYER